MIDPVCIRYELSYDDVLGYIVCGFADDGDDACELREYGNDRSAAVTACRELNMSVPAS